MQKNELIALVSNETPISKHDITLALESLLYNIKMSLANGDPVFIRGFGSFILKKRAAKKARNIHANKEIDVPEHYIPFFKPSPEFKQMVKTLQKKQEDYI